MARSLAFSIHSAVSKINWESHKRNGAEYNQILHCINFHNDGSWSSFHTFLMRRSAGEI